MKTFVAIQYPCWGKGKTIAIAKARLAAAAGRTQWKEMKAKGKPHIYESEDPDIYVNNEGFLAYKNVYPEPILVEKGS